MILKSAFILNEFVVCLKVSCNQGSILHLKTRPRSHQPCWLWVSCAAGRTIVFLMVLDIPLIFSGYLVDIQEIFSGYSVDIQWIFRGAAGKQIQVLSQSPGSCSGCSQTDRQTAPFIFICFSSALEEFWAVDASLHCSELCGSS